MPRGNRKRTSERDQLRERLQQQNRTPGQIAAAIAQHFKDRPLPAWRHAYGWTLDEVAARFNEVVGDEPGSMTRNRVSDYERWPRKGATKPTVRALAVLANVYSTTALNLIDPRDRHRFDAGELLALRAMEFVVAPRQLPGAIPNFVGRTQELKSLTARLDSAATGDSANAAAIASICGTAGIGKTTLTVYWARTHIDHFPDGQLYIDLCGFNPSGTPITQDTAIRSILNAFQVPPEKIPINPEDQAALYRSLVEGKRVMIVLDNARDTDQVLPLLPGSPTCMVLVTSRRQLGSLITLKRALHITLELMNTAEARQLLTDFLGDDRIHAEPEAIEELIGLCAGLPMALSISAARILLDPHLPLSALVSQLRQEHQRLSALSTGDSQLTDIRAVMSWSYAALSPQAARLFRLLGLHPGPDVSIPATASLAGLPKHDTQTFLAELARANLVKQHIPDRYQLHNLIHLYATELVTQEEPEPQRRAALHRVLDHYLHTAYAATLLIYPRPPITLNSLSPGATPEKLADYPAALAWFETERAILIAIVEAANKAGFTAHAWQLPWTFAAPFYRMGYWREFAATQYTALAAAQRSDDQRGQAHSHHDLGDACTWLTHFDESYNHHQQSLAIFSELNDQVGQADAHIGLAWVFAQQSHYGQAAIHAQQAIDLYHASGYQVGQANALNLFGLCQSQLGEHQQALASCQQALVLHRELKDRHGEAGTLHNIGSAYYYLGNHTEAITYLHQALDLKRQLRDRYSEAWTLTRLGDTYLATNNSDATRDFWQQSFTIFDQLGHPDAETLRARLAALDGELDIGDNSNQPI